MQGRSRLRDLQAVSRRVGLAASYLANPDVHLQRAQRPSHASSSHSRRATRATPPRGTTFSTVCYRRAP
ncbi:hypothetical protein ebA2613 [Aromatoleum aromaticum EbN1]|uniref:Uncharacterized protein n=1 Tax=Aromatoleum aromaticum (strain DSM 19018 / LMG 30748 / EbN1) TaxID=76114 RepID=Q5P519_AROAE|nr:hypothetical protein ebA2613 [Aromatoleum aromaticum EbN1]